MSVLRCAACLFMLQVSATLRADELLITNDGMPSAEIIVAESRPRMATLAALELRDHVQKLSGARLPIVTQATRSDTVRIYVGRSSETDRLGVVTDDLKYGAYRIASGPGWLALVGHDKDFNPTKMPWPMSRKDADRAVEEWNKAIAGKTDASWGYPFGSGFKAFWNPSDFKEQMTARYGDDFTALWSRPGQPNGFWEHDLGGSLNAVYGLLHTWGVRWYMPGKLGEVMPTRTTLAVKPINETVRPDYALRNWSWYNFAGFSYDDVIWARRLGMDSGYELLGPAMGPHGMVAVMATAEMKAKHPEYYALIGNRRDIEHRRGGTPCFTSKGLEQETVRYLRFLFDTYDLPSADIWPVDGLQVCQCETCQGKSASDLVWGFANRVARQILESHPTKRVTCGAYTSYQDPPSSTEKLSPNLAVWISNCRRPLLLDDERWNDYQTLLHGWTARIAAGNILRLENNRYHLFGEGPIRYPVIHPRSAARDLKSMKGVSLGDTGEQSQAQNQWRVPALEHITLYTQAQFLWDADQDVEALLKEYCELFYGPAADPMSEAIRYAELNLAAKDQSRNGGRPNPANVSLDVALQFRTQLDNARKTAGDTVYAQRIQAMIGALMPRDELIAKYRTQEQELAQARASAPLAKSYDGENLAGASEYSLRDNRTGDRPEAATTFRAGWDGANLILDVVCHEPRMQHLVISSDVRGGDNLAISLETPLHAYYHMEINPAGAIVQGNPSGDWKSLAEVTAHRDADSWRLKIRIPTVNAAEAASDPKHRVAGAKPTAEQPWYFNVGRQRVVDLKSPELQAFSPTRKGWHVPPKFGRLIVE